VVEKVKGKGYHTHVLRLYYIFLVDDRIDNATDNINYITY
jgi:hypothetical protein